MVACAGVAAYMVAPLVIAQRVRAQLAEYGFAHAQLEVESFGLDHLRLRDVRLDDDIELGRVELDRGARLLWSDPGRITIRDARANTAALARVGRRLATRSTSAARRASSLEISISARDPSNDGWTATASGRLVLGSDVTLEDGHIDVQVPKLDRDGVSLIGASLSAELGGNLSELALGGRGRLRAKRVEVGALAVTNASLPFTIERDRLSFASGRASMLGGVLVSDAFELSSRQASVVLHLRGVQLDRVLRGTRHVAGTGLLDGTLGLSLGASGMTLDRGELRARGSGTLQLRDDGMRAAIARAQGPLSVHAAIGAALTDFRYDSLVAELAAPGAPTELTLSTRGRGRRNQQALDIAINVRGIRDSASTLLKGLP